MTDRFSVLDHEYMNTGGHCMVSVFTVYDREAQALRYVIANDEGMNWQTMDTVGHEPEVDIEWEYILLMTVDWNDLKWSTYEKELRITLEMYRLFKYCQFEFYKKFCKTFDTEQELTIDDLPEELVEALTDDFISLHKQNEWNVTTDGYLVTPNPLYVDEQRKRIEEELQQIKDFKQWLDDSVLKGLNNGDVEKYYHEHFQLSFYGKTVSLPFDASTYDSISSLLKDVIEEW